MCTALNCICRNPSSHPVCLLMLLPHVWAPVDSAISMQASATAPKAQRTAARAAARQLARAASPVLSSCSGSGSEQSSSEQPRHGGARHTEDDDFDEPAAQHWPRRR